MAKKKKYKLSMPQIVELGIDELKPYANNPRFNEDGIPKVAASLKLFGWWQPVVIDSRHGNEIVVGHTRVAAAKTLGWVSVPTVDAKDLTDEQIAAYRLADNKTNEFSQWDEIKLDEEIAKLPNLDMAQFGFDMSGNGEGLGDAFGDGDNGGEGEPYKDADKVNFKIPIEFLGQVREWLRNGGREKAIKWILVQAGCIAEDDPLPEGTEIASEEDIGEADDGDDEFGELQ